MGKPIPEDAYDDLDQPTESGKNNILGLQGHLWGATFSTYNRVEYMALPRIISLAERAWSPNQEWMNIQDRTERLEALDIAWNEFANRLGQRELPRLDRMNGGYSYRIPSPGAIREDNMVEANVAYPGLDIRYTTDGSEPTVDSPRYSEPITVDENVIVKLRTFDTRGRGSRVVTME
jgi:hexosaminidase